MTGNSSKDNPGSEGIKKVERLSSRRGDILLDGRLIKHNEYAKLPSFLQPIAICRRKMTRHFGFFDQDNPLSNHYDCKFRVEGKEFLHMEQYLAFKRAWYSGNTALYNELFNAKNPVECKKIINSIRNYLDN